MRVVGIGYRALVDRCWRWSMCQRCVIMRGICGLSSRLIIAVSIVSGTNTLSATDVGAEHTNVQCIDLRVPMRDGVELAVRLLRPNASGKFPAVMAYNPYRQLSSIKVGPPGDQYSNVLNGPYFLADHGYVAVSYDVRGTGTSGGTTSDMYADEERQDGYDMVEWIARQPWSDGNVGMWGLSYGAVATWQVAALAPLHLKAIIVDDGTDDVYQDWAYPGGALRALDMFGSFATAMAALNFAPPDPDLSGEKWADIWQEHLNNNVPWSIDFFKHQTNDAYWRSRSLRPDYARIKCPALLIAGWAGYYPTAELRAFSKLKGPKRVLIGPWGHSWPEQGIPGPKIDMRIQYLRWFNQFLRGVDTGVLDAPPVTLYVNTYQPPAPIYREQPGFWRSENDWPLTRTRMTPLRLQSAGRLGSEAADLASGPTERDSYIYRASVGVTSGMLAGGTIAPWGMPLDQRPDEIHSLTYTGLPLSGDLEVTGTATVDLFISSSSTVAYFAVKLCDVAPDGTSKLITFGALNASHRTSNAQPEPLNPGAVYEIKFDLNSIAYIFPAGHRVRVDISSADFQNMWPASKAAVNTVLHGMDHPSRIILPVVPPQLPALPTPNLPPSPSAFPESLARPEYAMTYNPIDQTTTLSTTDGESHATYTVSDLDPAKAMIKGMYDYKVPQQDDDIEIEAETVTTSDTKVFHHLVRVEIIVGGRPYFEKSWAISVQRVLN